MFNQSGKASRANLLPLSRLGILESLQDGDHLLQSSDLLGQLGSNLGLILTQLLVEVLAVWGGRHGSTEDRLDNPGVVGLEGVAVGTAERVGEFRGGVVDVVTEGLDGKVEASGEKSQLSVNRSCRFVEMEAMPLQLTSSIHN